MKELKGICAASCTPFKEAGERLDEMKLREHIDYLIDAGVHIVLVCGGTGEFAYLREEEKKRIIDISAKQINGRAAFMVQSSAINTEDAVNNSKYAEDAGADGLLILPPYFEGPGAEGVFYHYERISNAISIPIIAYNIPVYTGFDITPKFFKRLTDEIENIKYLKDSTGDFIRIRDLIETLGNGSKIFNGVDPIAFESLVAGVNGCIWGAVNVMPKECVELYKLVNSGDLVSSRELWNKMFPSNMFFWKHNYNASVKTATNLVGRNIGECRKPVLPLNNSEIIELETALKHIRE